MRWTLLITAALVASMMIMLAGCETGQKRGADRESLTDEPIAEETATLVVHGMGCPLCANNVDKQLLAVPGVTDVSIDMGSGAVTVHLAENNRPSKRQLARAVDESGFTLVSITAP